MSDCILHRGKYTSKGHGHTSRKINGVRVWDAHRIAWTLANGPIPEKTMVLHKCDTPACINVEHLYLGDAKQNMADRIARGPNRSGHDVLTLEKVREMRVLRSHGLSYSSIARKFGVAESTARYACIGKTWNK